MTTPTLREAAQLALEALEYHAAQTRPIERTTVAIEALRAALAAPMEPDDATQEQIEALDDLVTLVRRLVRALAKAAPDNEMTNISADYLERLGFNRGPFRSATTAPQVQPPAPVEPAKPLTGQS